MLDEFLKDPSKIGATVLLLLAVVAFFREWVVPGTVHAREIAKLEKERDEFKDMALRGLELTRRTIDVAQRAKDGT